MENGYVSVNGGGVNLPPKNNKKKIIRTILLWLGIFVIRQRGCGGYQPEWMLQKK